MISPCNKVCVMDGTGRYCRGCARTLDEIARWGSMSDAERARVTAELPARQAASPDAHPSGNIDADA